MFKEIMSIKKESNRPLLQVIHYLSIKHGIEKEVRKTKSIAIYPALMFLNCTLDKYYIKGGLPLAQVAWQIYLAGEELPCLHEECLESINLHEDGTKTVTLICNNCGLKKVITKLKMCESYTKDFEIHNPVNEQISYIENWEEQPIDTMY